MEWTFETMNWSFSGKETSQLHTVLIQISSKYSFNFVFSANNNLYNTAERLILFTIVHDIPHAASGLAF